MIISASRRTDIPAFYSEWFLNRLNAGYVYIKNPMNPKQISKVSLAADVVDCIVFWTKNAAPMLDKLDMIDSMGYPYYFQWTITPYGKEVECNLPDKETIIDSFKTLSAKIGSHRTIWRYDPIIISRQFPVAYHVQAFENMCHLLRGYTKKCIFSFVDFYAKICKRLKGVADQQADTQTMLKVAEMFSEIAKRNNISLKICCEQIELSRFGIVPSSCINKQTIESIIHCSINAKRVQGQRALCGCVESIDIGAYNCCSHGCVYCYATSSDKAIFENRKQHNSNSPLLIGRVETGDTVTERISKSLKRIQGSLF